MQNPIASQPLNRRAPKIALYFGAVFLLLADRLAKAAAINIWSKTPLTIFSWLKLDYFLNKGLAFSLPIGNTPAIIISVLICLGLLFTVILSKNWLTKLLLTIIVVFAINNNIDRLLYGGVIDWINIPYFSVFNLSDAAITITVSWLTIKSSFIIKGESTSKL